LEFPDFKSTAALASFLRDALHPSYEKDSVTALQNAMNWRGRVETYSKMPFNWAKSDDLVRSAAESNNKLQEENDTLKEENQRLRKQLEIQKGCSEAGKEREELKFQLESPPYDDDDEEEKEEEEEKEGTFHLITEPYMVKKAREKKEAKMRKKNKVHSAEKTRQSKRTHSQQSPPLRENKISVRTQQQSPLN